MNIYQTSFFDFFIFEFFLIIIVHDFFIKFIFWDLHLIFHIFYSSIILIFNDC